MTPARPTSAQLATWERLLRFQRRTLDRLDAELRAETGLALDEYDVLHQLASATRGRLRMGELADAVLITRSSCSRLVDRLAREGLVERVRDEHDRRVVWATPTAEGRRRHRRAAPAHVRGIGRWVIGPLDDEAEAGLESALRCWEAAESPLR